METPAAESQASEKADGDKNTNEDANWNEGGWGDGEWEQGEWEEGEWEEGEWDGDWDEGKEGSNNCENSKSNAENNRNANAEKLKANNKVTVKMEVEEEVPEEKVGEEVGEGMGEGNTVGDGNPQNVNLNQDQDQHEMDVDLDGNLNVTDEGFNQANSNSSSSAPNAKTDKFLPRVNMTESQLITKMEADHARATQLIQRYFLFEEFAKLKQQSKIQEMRKINKEESNISVDEYDEFRQLENDNILHGLPTCEAKTFLPFERWSASDAVRFFGAYRGSTSGRKGDDGSLDDGIQTNLVGLNCEASMKSELKFDNEIILGQND